MDHFFSRDETISALQKMTTHLFLRLTQVRNKFVIYELFAIPNWSLNYINVGVTINDLQKWISLINSFNLVLTYKIVIVSILIEVKLKLLEVFQLLWYWPTTQICAILELDVLNRKILRYNYVVKKPFDVPRILTVRNHFIITSYNFVRDHGALTSLFISII